MPLPGARTRAPRAVGLTVGPRFPRSEGGGRGHRTDGGRPCRGGCREARERGPLLPECSQRPTRCLTSALPPLALGTAPPPPSCTPCSGPHSAVRTPTHHRGGGTGQSHSGRTLGQLGLLRVRRTCLAVPSGARGLCRNRTAGLGCAGSGSWGQSPRCGPAAGARVRGAGGWQEG